MSPLVEFLLREEKPLPISTVRVELRETLVLRRAGGVEEEGGGGGEAEEEESPHTAAPFLDIRVSPTRFFHLCVSSFSLILSQSLQGFWRLGAAPRSRASLPTRAIRAKTVLPHPLPVFSALLQLPPTRLCSKKPNHRPTLIGTVISGHERARAQTLFSLRPRLFCTL